MNQLSTVFEGKEVRIVGTEEQPLLVLRDVCDVLGIQNTQPIVQRYEEDGVFSKYIIQDRFGRSQEMTVVNEEGLYEILFDSRKQQAKKFRKWVTSEVLPSIRKDGGYIAAAPEETPEEIMAKAVILAHKRIEELKTEREQALLQLEAQKPLVAFAEVIEKSDDSLLVREYVKAISKRGFVIGEKRMFQWLRDNQFIDRKNVPYQRYIDQGLFEVTEYPVTRTSGIQLKFTTRITAKGQVYFYDKLTRGEAV